MSIIVDSSTSHFPEIKSFVEAVRQYCKMIESIDNQKELCTFLRQVAASIAHLYTCAFNLVTNYWTHFYAAFTSNCTGLTKSNDE